MPCFFSQKAHREHEILARKPRYPTEAVPNRDVSEGREISSARKHQITAFLASKAFTHSRYFRGTTRFLCQNLPLTLHSAGRLKPCVRHAATAKNRCVRIKETCIRQIVRSLSHRLTGASACSTIPLAMAKQGANDPFRHRIKRNNARRDSKRAKRPMREWG